LGNGFSLDNRFLSLGDLFVVPTLRQKVLRCNGFGNV
jgi:hypothetical protein